MGKAKKTTKKFLKNELADEYERRKKIKPIKAKAAAKTAREASRKKEAKERASTRAATTIAKASPIGEMDVGDFLAKGFRSILSGDDEDEGEADVDGVSEDEDDDSEDENAGEVAGPAVGSTVSAAGTADEDEDPGSGDDDDDDDDDDDEDDSASASVDGLKAEISKHKASLEKLKREQPEFYAFMKENDPSLLDFAEGGASESESDEEEEGGPAVGSDDDEEAGDSEDEEAPAAKKTGRVITMLMVRQWTKGLADPSNGKSHHTLRAVVMAYSAATSFGDEEDEDAPKRSKRYRIESGKVFNAVLNCALRHVPTFLDRVCAVKPAKPGRGAPLPSTSKGYTPIKGMIKSFLESTLHLVEKISSEETDIFMLNSMTHMCSYFACFPKLNRALLKLMLHRWSHAAESVRVAAFLVIRMSAIVSPYPFIDLALKGIYLTFIRNCKFPTPVVRPTLTFMLNAVVELYRLDEVAAYQHAFVYIRQLAIHLRNAIVAKKKDSYLAVYNWQFLYALRVWAKLLAVVMKDDGGSASGLKPLIYPLVQVTMGAIRLIPTPRYFAYRFHCVRLLAVLAEGTGVYIPLTHVLLDVFENSELKKKPKPVTGKPLVLQNLLKVPKSQLNSPQFQDAAAAEATSLALRAYTGLAYSISFPECVFPEIVRIRKFLKECKSVSVSKRLKPVLEKLEENSAFIQRNRANGGFSPKDHAAVTAWEETLKAAGQSPLARYYRVLEASEENRKRMQEATQVVEGEDYRKRSRAQDDSDDDSDGGSATKKKGKKKHAKKEVETPAAAEAMDEDEEEDTVRDFMLDDFAWDSD